MTYSKSKVDKRLLDIFQLRVANQQPKPKIPDQPLNAETEVVAILDPVTDILAERYVSQPAIPPTPLNEDKNHEQYTIDHIEAQTIMLDLVSENVTKTPDRSRNNDSVGQFQAIETSYKQLLDDTKKGG